MNGIKEKNRVLLERALSGDRMAEEELIKENMGLVKIIAARFTGRGTELEDLVQIGAMGMLKAIRGYDSAFNTAFSTYAVPMIVGEIRRCLRDNHSVRVSRSIRDVAYKALQAKEVYIKQNNLEPTMEQISQMIDVPFNDVVFALDAIADPVSLFEPVYHDGEDATYIVYQVKDN